MAENNKAPRDVCWLTGVITRLAEMRLQTYTMTQDARVTASSIQRRAVSHLRE